MRLNELEIKIQITSEEHFHSIFNACKRLFGSPRSHIRQLDEYYDTSDRQLKKQDLVIRIRTSVDGEKKKTIALKSPRIDLESGATKRIELEFVSGEGEQVQEQLLSQGLFSHESAEKERWTFAYQECEIVLDKLPFIGPFIEIEGPSEEAIHEIVSLLELASSPVIRKNYGELMLEKFQQLGLPTDQMHATFAKEKAGLRM
jgi:predicted adenylyl cyclase CyaB